MLLECVLGALGLAIERSAFRGAVDEPAEPPQKKAIRWKKSLQRRLESLIALRRHIEAIRHRVQSALSSERKEHLLASLARHEQRYRAGILRLRKGHSKLARLERMLGSSQSGSVG